VSCRCSAAHSERSDGLRGNRGLVVATLLTLVFLPALYMTWFRIEPAKEELGNADVIGVPTLANA
jgi:hypothetical protein